MAEQYQSDQDKSELSGEKLADDSLLKAKKPESEFLDAILHQTRLSSSTEDASPLDLTLAEVAKQHAGESLSLDPIVCELVSAVLRSLWDQPSAGEASWDPMVREVAVSLYNDPPSRERLEAFWTKLSDSQS